MTALFVCASAGCIFDEPSLSTDEIPPGNNATSMGNNANSGTSSSNQDTGAPNNTSSPNGATSAANNTGGNGETGAPNNTEPTPNNNVDPPPNNANPSDCTDFNALATTRCPEWGDFVAYGSFTTDPEGIPAPDLCESLGQDETLYSCAQENTSCLEMILCIEDRASGELFLDSPSLDCQFLQEELIFACTGEWELYPESGNFLDRCSERDEVDGDVFDCLETAGTCQEVAACIDTNMDLELPFDDNPGGCAAGFACEAASGQVECPASDFGTPCRACGLTCDAVDEICANGALIEPRCGQDDPDCNIFACGTVACQQAPQGDCSMVSGGLVCHARGDAAGSPYCARPCQRDGDCLADTLCTYPAQRCAPPCTDNRGCDAGQTCSELLLQCVPACMAGVPGICGAQLTCNIGTLSCELSCDPSTARACPGGLSCQQSEGDGPGGFRHFCTRAGGD